MQRIMLFRDPAGFVEDAGGFFDSAKDKQFFTRDAYSAEQVEAFRQGAEGMTRDLTIERLDWPFELEEIHTPTVLVFHGEEDTLLHPRIGEYACMRIPSCDELTIYPGEGHSAVYYRYQEIIQAMLEV
jgi:pimeloyl-ACP methyl ester carboxylesterase